MGRLRPRDALLVHATPRGPTCHTGAASCFFTPVLGDCSAPLLDRLCAEIGARKAGRGTTSATGKSYVRSLMDGGVPAIAAKLHEEAGELAEALAGDDRDHIAREADEGVEEEVSGLDEKVSREQPSRAKPT